MKKKFFLSLIIDIIVLILLINTHFQLNPYDFYYEIHGRGADFAFILLGCLAIIGAIISILLSKEQFSNFDMMSLGLNGIGSLIGLGLAFIIYLKISLLPSESDKLVVINCSQQLLIAAGLSISAALYNWVFIKRSE